MGSRALPQGESGSQLHRSGVFHRPRGSREPEGLSKSVALPKGRTSGAPSGRVRSLVGSLSAPRLRRYIEPLPLAYRLFRGQPKLPAEMDLGFPTQAGADEPLRWFVTPAAKRDTTLSQMRSQARSAVLLRRRIPRPEKKTARVLMDEGWGKFTAGATGGDKWWARNHSSESRYPSPAGCANKGRPGFRRGDTLSGVATNDRRARGTGLRPVWRRPRPSPPARRNCRSQQSCPCRKPGCAWRCAPWRDGGR